MNNLNKANMLLLLKAVKQSPQLTKDNKNTLDYFKAELKKIDENHPLDKELITHIKNDSNIYSKDLLVTQTNGEKYTDSFINVKPQGEVICKFNNSTIYGGGFDGDLLHGKGILKYANGDIYEGNFVNGMAHGMGILKYANGDIYEGNFINQVLTGRVIITYKNGGKYSANVEDMVIDDKDRYLDVNKNIRLVGDGIAMSTDKNILYSGEFIDSRAQGKGVLYNALQGTTLKGDFIKDSLTGMGVVTYHNIKKCKIKFENIADICSVAGANQVIECHGNFVNDKIRR
jgi:hypothetical protein